MNSALNWPGIMTSFAGRKVLVTGGSGGIGASVASAFADCGAAVAIHYGRNKKTAEDLVEQVRARGGQAVAVGGDLSNVGGGSSLVQEAAAALGGLDIVIHNAGGPMLRESFETLSAADRERIVQVNLLSSFEVLQAAIPLVKTSKNGAIIVTTSVAVRNGGGTGVSVYGASKAALESMVRSLAIELAPDGVRINGVAPGYIETGIHDGLSSPEEREKYIAKIPARRAGKPEDCVGPYLFFASHELSGYVTGQTLDVNGGMTVR